MLSKPLIALTASLVIVTPGLASARLVAAPARVMQPAQNSVQPNHKKPAVKAGIVGSDGTIIAGSNFSVSHDGTGEYTLDVPAGYFKNCPVVMVTPAGVNGHAQFPTTTTTQPAATTARSRFRSESTPAPMARSRTMHSISSWTRLNKRRSARARFPESALAFTRTRKRWEHRAF